MKKRIIAICLILAMCLCGCAGQKGPATGTPVFPKGEVERAVLYREPEAEVEVPTEHLRAIVDWAQSFTYDRPMEDDLMAPGANTFSVTLYYADGSTHTCGIDVGWMDGTAYYISREKPPVCWEPIWDMYDTEWVELSEGYANMALEIPAGWDYSYHRGDSDAGMGLAFYPRSNLRVDCGLWFYPDFAMCGTGVTFEEVTVGQHKLTRATEKLQDGTLSAIYIFHDLPGDYVATVNLPIGLWPEYEPQILSILESAELAEGILTKEEAIALATEECTIEHDTVDARFHHEDGVWSVNFYTQNTAGGDQTVTVGPGGEILTNQYGE